ncbi:MAG: metallophosphoesterase [Actinomycetota bacterium]
MTQRPELAADIVRDLLRSAWIVEAARAAVFEEWGTTRERFLPALELARRRGEIVARALAAHATRPDTSIAAAHALWMKRCVPGPDEPFADLFLARLGGWVDAHAGAYLGDDPDGLQALGEQERSTLQWPSEIPAAPPFRRLTPPALPVPAEARMRIGVLGDLHIGSPLGEATATAAIADLNRSGSDVVVQLGDITDHGEEHEFERAAALLARLEMQWATMIGNHDAYAMSEGRLAGRERFARWFGRDPDGALLEHPGVRIVVLDSVEYGISPYPPYDLVAGTFSEGDGGAIVRGALSAPQHDILAEVAAPGAPPALVFLHHPPQPFAGFPPVIFGLRDVDSGRLHATCDSGNVWGIFAGHTHRNSRGEPLADVPVHEVGVPRDFPFTYALIDVVDDGYTYRCLQISDEELLREAYPGVGAIQRRYSLGDDDERAFSRRR